MGRKHTGIRVSLLAFGMLALCGGTGTLAAQIVESKLTAFDAAPGDFFGTSVAMRGRTAVVGAHQMNVGAGAAYVFHYNGNNWTQTARLNASDGVLGDQFGSAVAIGNNTIVVGAEGDADAGASTGAAYVFQLQGAQWVQTQKLTASDPQAGAHFGASAAIDGNTLLVGAWGRNGIAGAAYVFEQTNGTWQQTALLVPGDVAVSDFFSHFVALEGDTALVGSPGDDDLGSSSGSAYVFTRSNGIWTQTQKLVASDGAASDLLALAGSISGNTMVIGARGNDDLGSSSGSAYVFQLLNGSWTQTAKLLPGDGRANDVFGHSVGISGDRIVVGAKWRDDNLQSNSGAAYVFDRVDSQWWQTGKLNAVDPMAVDEYGDSIAIDGTITLVGAHRKSFDRGAVYAYHPVNVVDVDQSAITAEDQAISAYGGETRILVTPKKADGTIIGTGLAVELSAVGGSLVGSVADHGDGTYSQTLQGTPGTGEAVVSAVVEGLALTSTAVVTLLPVSLSTSTVVVSPEEIAPGESAMVTVTPKTDTGTNSGAGFQVTIETTLGTLIGAVIDNGDGTYGQLLETSTQGTASISASVNGLALSDTATLAVVPPTPEGRIVGIDTNGTAHLFKSIQDAVDHATDSMKIMVAPGDYDEVVHIEERSNLTIQALPTLGLTTIRGLSIKASRNITIDGIHVDAIGSQCRGIDVHECDGVVLRNGLVQRAHCERSGIKIKLNGGAVRLENFGVEGCGDDGISVRADADHDGQLTILRCLVRDNEGNGICLDKHSRVKIEGCTISNNGLKGRDDQGYGVLRQRQSGRRQVKGDSVLLIGNAVTGNHGRVIGGTSNKDFGNYDQMIDGSDDQAPFND